MTRLLSLASREGAQALHSDSWVLFGTKGVHEVCAILLLLEGNLKHDSRPLTATKTASTADKIGATGGYQL